MNFLFLMDALETVVMAKDTTFILMWGAHQRSHRIFYLSSGGITRKNGQALFHVTEVVPQIDPKNPFLKQKDLVLPQEEVDIIFVRTDPPFDEEYLTHTWLLDLLPSSIPIINNPTGIRTVNEKIWATQFTSIIPPTLISRNRRDLLGFILEEKEVVIKPTNGHGGKGVFRLKAKDTNTNVILETSTDNWRKDIIVQQYLPESVLGDKRILLLDGEPLGAVLRVHASDDHRNNFFSGGKPVVTKVNERDMEIINIFKPELKRLGLYFVGIDIMGEYLIEVNVTSPTCLQEMNTLNEEHLEEKVIVFAEKLIDQFKSQDKIGV